MKILIDTDELIEYLNECLSNSYFHNDIKGCKLGYTCAISDLGEYFDRLTDEINKEIFQKHS